MACCSTCDTMRAELARALEEAADLREEVGELHASLVEWNRAMAEVLRRAGASPGGPSV